MLLDCFAQQLERQRVPIRSDRFSRMFDLPSFAEPTAQTQAALMELGAPGGLMDAKDPLHEGSIRLITNPELSPHNRDNTAATAGVTFLGQFKVEHGGLPELYDPADHRRRRISPVE
jgi:hypothetical protein